MSYEIREVREWALGTVVHPKYEVFDRRNDTGFTITDCDFYLYDSDDEEVASAVPLSPLPAMIIARHTIPMNVFIQYSSLEEYGSVYTQFLYSANTFQIVTTTLSTRPLLITSS